MKPSNQRETQNATALLESIIQGHDATIYNYNEEAFDSVEHGQDDITTKFLDGHISFEEYKIYISRESKKGYSSFSSEDSNEDDSINDTDWNHTKGQAKDNFSSSSHDEYEPTTSKKKNTKTRVRGHPKFFKSKLPKNLQGLMGSANLHWVSGQKLEAKELCNEIIRSKPAAFEPYALLGVIYEDLGDQHKAYQYTRLAAHLDPNSNPERYVKLAKFCSEIEDDPKEAIKFLHKAITSLKRKLKNDYQVSNDIVKLQKEIATIYEDIGNNQKAIAEYKSLLAYISRTQENLGKLPEVPADRFLQLVNDKIEITTKIANHYFSLLNIDLALETMHTLFQEYPTTYFDVGTINMYIDLLLNAKRYSDVLLLVGQYVHVDLVHHSLCQLEQNTLNDNDDLLSIEIPQNLPIDISVKLATAIIQLQKFKLPYVANISDLDNSHSYNFRRQVYDNLVDKILDALIKLEPNLYGDLYVDICESFKFKHPKHDTSGTTGPPTTSSTNLAENVIVPRNEFDSQNLELKQRFAARALPFYQKLLGVQTGTDVYMAAAHPSTYASTPGVWLSYAEALESLGQIEAACDALRQVLRLAPQHQISKFKLDCLVKELVTLKGYKPRQDLVDSSGKGFNLSPQTERESRSMVSLIEDHHRPQQPIRREIDCVSNYSDPLNLVLSTYVQLDYLNGLADHEYLTYCFNECKKYYTPCSVQTSDKIASPLPTTDQDTFNNHRFISLGLSLFFSLVIDNIKASKVSEFSRKLIVSTIYTTCLSLLNKPPPLDGTTDNAHDIDNLGELSRQHKRQDLRDIMPIIVAHLNKTAFTSSTGISRSSYKTDSFLGNNDFDDDTGDATSRGIPTSLNNENQGTSSQAAVNSTMPVREARTRESVEKTRQITREIQNLFQILVERLCLIVGQRLQSSPDLKNEKLSNGLLIVHTFDDLLFLYVCALGLVDRFTAARIIKAIRVYVIYLMARSRRWNAVFKYGKVLYSSSFLHIFPFCPTSFSLTRVNFAPSIEQGAADVSSSHNYQWFTQLINLIFSSFRAQNMVDVLRPTAESKTTTQHIDIYFKCPAVITDMEHVAKASPLKKFLWTFLDSQLKILDGARTSKTLDACVYFTMSLAYACLAHSSGYFAIAIGEIKHLLRLIEQNESPSRPTKLEIDDRNSTSPHDISETAGLTSTLSQHQSHQLVPIFSHYVNNDSSPPNNPFLSQWLTQNSHLPAQLYLMLGINLLQLVCQPGMYVSNSTLDPALVDMKRSHTDYIYTDKPVNMLPLTYAFVALAQYLKLRGPCQESWYNIGRAYHQINLLSMALYYYEKALETGPPPIEFSYNFDLSSTPQSSSSQGECIKNFDLTREIAYNMRHIYITSGSPDMAHYISQKYLTL